MSAGEDPRLGLALADFLSARNDFDVAYLAWTQIVSGGSKFPFVAVRPYLDRLLGRGRYQDARAIWNGPSSSRASSQSRRTARRAIGCSMGVLNNCP